MNTYCYLIAGLTGGCIYNLVSGEMISVDEKTYKFLKKCENNEPLKKATNEEAELLADMLRKQIGMYYDNAVYIDKFYIGSHPKMDTIMPPNYAISNVFLELDTKCNFNCVFCKNGDNTLFRMTGCKRWKTSTVIREIKIWKSVIDQVSKLGCKQITFIGGEPFLQINELKELIPYAKLQGIGKILIFTNGSLLNDDAIKLIKTYDIELNVQLLAGYAETYARIAGVPDAANIVSKNIFSLVESDINYSLTYLVSRMNENEIQTALDHYGLKTDANKMRLAYLYPLPNNDYYSEKFVEAMYDKKKTLRKIDVSSFCNAMKFHNCFGHQLAVTAQGDLLPCIMSRSLALGNVKDADIVSLLSDSNYDYFKGLTKDAIEGCKECAYRYGCFDCRALELSATGRIEGMEYCRLKQQYEPATLKIGSGKREEEKF